MKDISIKSVIRRIHSTIIGFFIILIFSLCVAFIGLQYGITIHNLKLPHLHIEQLYIKWNKGIILTVDKVLFTSDTSDKTTSKTTAKHYEQEVFLVLKYSRQLSDLINKIDIKQLVFNNLTATFRYKIGEKSFFNANSNTIHLLSNIDADQNKTIIKIEHFADSKRKIDANGTLLLNRQKQTMQGDISLAFDHNTTATLALDLKDRQLHYALHCDQNITNLQQIVKRFPIPKEITPWIYDAIQVKSVKIDKLQGYVDLNHPEQSLKNLFVKLNFHHLIYTFDKNLPPIVSSNTILKIQNGTIFIYPKNATFSKQALQKSWLDINLLSPHTILTIHLLSDLQLSGELKKLLDYYKVKIPFAQTTSTTKTDLNIALNLYNSHVDAEGVFHIKRSIFSYNGANIAAQNGTIALKNSKVTIKQLTLLPDKDVNISINGTFDVLNNKANLLFHPNKITTGDGKKALQLETTQKPWQYKVTGFQSKLFIPATTWIYDNKHISVNKLSCNVDQKTKILQIPTTKITSGDALQAKVSGFINLKNLKSHFDAKISKFHYRDVLLAQRSLILNISHEEHFIITTPSMSRWIVGGQQIHLFATTLHVTPNYLYVNKTDVTTTNGLSGSLMMVYNTQEEKGDLFLEHLQLKDALLDRLFATKGIVHLQLKTDQKQTTLYSKALDSNITFNDQGFWIAYCNLNAISKKIAKLQEYHLTKGYVKIASRNNNQIVFSGDIDYPYSILYKNGAPVYRYKFRGTYGNGISDFTVNKNLSVKIADNIRIKADHLGINLSGINALLRSNKSSSKKSQHLAIYAQASDSYLHLDKNVTILADKIDLIYLNSILTANLTHDKGTANLRMDEKDNFYLYGTNFDDKFMNHFFTGSEFHGGNLSFVVRGVPKEYAGFVEIKDTVLKNYSLLNNILAFVNTIPSLATFSLPGYSSEGLATKKIYLGFDQKDNILHCKNISLESKKINIYGKGDANLSNKTLNLDLNLKTNIASGMSKIPLVGYILFNKNSISTSLKVTGKFHDPKIQTSLAQDIVVAPVNIIKRTLLSPLELLMPTKEFNDLVN